MLTQRPAAQPSGVQAPHTGPRYWPSALAVVAVAAAANGLLLAPLPLEIRLIGGLTLYVCLPGHLLVQAVFNGPGPGVLERRLLALASGYALTILFTLTLYTLVRPLSAAQLIVGGDVLNGGLLVAALTRRADLGLRFTRPGWPLVLAMALAATLRLVNLGYSDFQGDEAKVVLRSMAVLQGIPDALIAHRKPPGEILLSVPFMGTLGTITEQTVRLPFALAGVAGVLAFYQLGRAMFGARSGLIAALLLAITGYFVAFGRILQYPSPTILLDTLAVLCLYRFGRGSSVRSGYAVIGALLLAGAGLTALSAIFLLPVAGLALWAPLLGLTRATWRPLAAWLWPLALLVPSLLLVYVLLPRGSGDTLDLGSTLAVYMGYRLGGNRPYFNLEAFVLSVNHYNSSLYLLVVLGAGLLVLLEPLYEHLREVTRRLGLSSLGLATFAWLALDVQNLALALLLVVALAWLVVSAQRPLAWRLATAWLAGPLFAHLFLVRLVGTHWREMLPGMLLLVAASTSSLYGRLADRRARLAALLAGALFLIANAHYVYVAWIQTWPEYQLTYPLYRHPLDWSNQQVARGGSILGATRHHGWKAVGYLMAHGELPSEYATNVRPEAAWYFKSARLCPEVAQLVVQPPTSVRERRVVESGETLPGFFLAGWTSVSGRRGLSLQVRASPPVTPRVYRAEDYDGLFDRDLASPWAPVGRLYWPLVNADPLCPEAR